MSNSPALPTQEKNTFVKTVRKEETPEFKVSGVFSSHMVLQREREIKIYGFSNKEGAEITGEFDGEICKTTVKDAAFTLTFSPRSASLKPLKMSIYDGFGHRTDFEDILIGDVWVTGGQSNAELNLSACLSETPVEKYDDDGIYRLFMQTQEYPFTHKEFCDYPQKDIICPDWRWKKPDKNASDEFSALGYFFAKGLSESLNIPIGVINMSAGGSTVRELAPEELAHKMGYYYGANVREGGFYNTLINPFVGISFKGMLFFQGESEGGAEETAEVYDTQLRELIEDERERFGFDFPLYNIQASDYRTECKQHFPFMEIIRAKQYDAQFIIDNSTLTVSYDLGSDDGYHDFAHSPKKKALADRLLNLALAKEYGTGDINEASSPMPRETVKEEGKIRLIFDNVSPENPLTGDGKEVRGFSFGEIGNLTLLRAEITGYNEVTADTGGCDFEYLNFAYFNHITPDNVTLRKKSGLPVPAFRIKI